MGTWFINTAGLRARLLKGGLGIIFLMGLLTCGTGVYFGGEIDWAAEVRSTAGRVLSQRSQARNAEKDFRLSDLTATEFYRDEQTRNLDKHQAAMAALEKEIWTLIKLLPSENEERLKALSVMAHKYQKDFLELVIAYRQRGFKAWGFEGAWRLAMSDVAGYVERTQNVFAVRTLLDLIQDEKDYILQNDESYAQAIFSDLKELKRMVLAHSEASSITILEAIEKYEVAFTDYILIQQKIGLTEDMGLQGEMQRTAEAMEPIIRDIHAMSIQVGDRARRNFIAVISIIWTLGLVGGGIFFYFHAGSIANPIIQLKDAAVKIGQGDLATHIAIDSKDEVGVLARAFNQMAAGLSQAQEALRESESHSRLIIETAHDAFVGVDVDGLIIDWNQQAENLFGWSREEIIGRRFDDMIAIPQTHGPQTEGYRHFLSTAEDPVLDQRLEVTAIHRQERHFPVEMTVWAIQLGDSYRFNAFIHDISERKQAEQMKSDFVSFVTHQLRTPLAGIKWLLELASQENAIPDEALSYTQDARESADRLIRLVNDLLDISRLERGKITIAPEQVKLGELTHSVLSEVNLLVQAKEHQLHCLLTETIPSVLVDRQLIRQVILNLVSNAIKYTPTAGDISVRLGQVGNTIQWSITDSGIGIPKAAQSRLFEKFYRAENGYTVETEGTGLGLYLVRLILSHFGGRVWCESDEGQGATFLFTLPLPE